MSSELLQVLGAPAHLEVIEERQELLRFAESRVTYQHSEERVLVRARIIRDGRVAWGTTSTLDPGSLGALRDRLEMMVCAIPPGGEAGLTPPDGLVQDSAMTFFHATDRATADDRAAFVRRALDELLTDVMLGGSIAHTTIRHSVANTDGLLREERRTRAGVQLIGTRADGASSFGRAVHRDAASLPVERVIDEVRAGLSPASLRSLDVGEYRAVLGPQATLTLLAMYAQVALGGRQYLDGSSALSGCMGQRVASQKLTLVDDGVSPDGLPTSFDCDGLPKRRVTLLEGGVLKGVVHDAETARLAEATPTGHTAPPGWRFGADPIPSHVFVEAGILHEDELLAACDTGLLIQRVDYVRVLNARRTLVTGTTRDATRWIEGGRVAARLPQFRFTVRLADLLNSVEAVGRRREVGDTVFMESVVAPSVLVSRFPVHTVVTV